MSELRPDGEAALRRALHAATEQVEPGDNSLARIQGRVRHRRPMPLPLAWADIALTRLSLRVPDGFWSGWDLAARELRVAIDRFLPSPARARSGRSDRFRLGWLRPVAAMSTAVFIVAAVVYMAIEVPQVISPAGTVAQSSLHSSGPQPGRGARTGPGQSATKSGSRTSTSPTGSSNGPNSKTCSPASPSPGRTITSAPPSSPGPTAPPSQSSGPSPTPSSGPSQTSNPSPTPSASLSTAPAGTGNSPSTGSITAAATVKHAALATTTRRAGKVRATRQPSAPCPTASPTKKSPVLVSPQAAAALILPAEGDVLAPGQVRGRIA